MNSEEKAQIEDDIEDGLTEHDCDCISMVLDVVMPILERAGAREAAYALKAAYDRMTVDFDGDMDLAAGLGAAKLRIKDVLDEVQKGLPLMPIRLAFPVTEEEKAKLRAAGWVPASETGPKIVHGSTGMKARLDAIADAAEARKENDILRGLVAKVVGKCVHCGLEDKSKCLSGFPGCAWADDVLVGDDVYAKDLVIRLRLAETRLANVKAHAQAALHAAKKQDRDGMVQHVSTILGNIEGRP